MARGDKQVNVWPLRMDERGKFRPKADPGGDYAQELFDKADTVHPGATAALEAKARAVVGATVDRREAMLKRRTDVSIGYCSSRKTTPDLSVTKMELPPELAVTADYGLAIVTTGKDAPREAAAAQLALFLLSPAAQSILPEYGCSMR